MDKKTFGFLLVGAIGGLLSGLLGIGGAVIMIPALVYIFRLPQKRAQATILLLSCIPVGSVLALWMYQRAGFGADIPTAGLVLLGFSVMSFFGSRLATRVNSGVLKKIFAMMMILMGVKILLF